MAGPVPTSSTAPSAGGSPPPAPPLDWRERLDDLRRRTTVDGRWAVWALVAMAAAGVGLWLLRPTPTPVEESLPVASTSSPIGGDPATETGATGSTAGPTMPTEIVAHAAGAVGRPGVYRLDGTSRVDDLVRMAGGLGPDADASRLNLAAPLTDGTRVYVPRIGEEVPVAVGPDGTTSGPATEGSGGEGAPVDLNTADEAALDELPGVGPATAAAIVAFREENGGFRTVDDLLDVRGIGEAKMEQLRPLVTVG